MKTYFFLLIQLLAFCICPQISSARAMPLNPLLLVNAIQKTNPADVIFKFKFHYVRGHRNEAGVCIERGICEFDIKIGFRTTNPKDLDAELTKDPYGNLLLLISKSGLDTDEAIDLTGFSEGPGTFYLSNTSDIPEEAKMELGLPKNYRVNPGSYQVTDTPSYYIVNFRQ